MARIFKQHAPLSRDVLKNNVERWDEESIRTRTAKLSEIIISAWPVLNGHRSPRFSAKPRRPKKVRLPDLISAGMLQPGITLVPRSKKFSERLSTLLPDGMIEVEGKTFSSPSDAATTMVGQKRNGWWFFLVDPATKRSLRQVRRDYVEQLTIDTEDDVRGRR